MLMALSFNVRAQVSEFSLRGTVKDNSGKGVESANIMLRRFDAKAMIGFVLTEPDGTYSITVNTEADTLVVMLSGFNISSHSRTVTRQTGTADFTVSVQEQKIREAKVMANPIKRESDTLTYYVAQFKEETDRSIGDVLMKLPGIEVSSNGGIKYNGKSINRFYIEGMDMLGGKYGIATNNIQASDIATIEVYENHQPLKVLQGWARSDEAALNLKLKQGARGTWNGVIELGGGYSPAIWDASFTPMMFSRKFQTILTYKTNNTGHDVSQELRSQFGGVDDIPSLVSVTAPGAPPLDESFWLKNNIHAASANGILKINDDSDITTTFHYIHDIQHSSGTTRTEYHVPGSTPFTIEENTSLEGRSGELEFEVQYRHNSNKRYVLDGMSVKTEMNEYTGEVSKGGSLISQKSSIPFFNATNRLQYVKTIGNTQLTARSTTSFSSRNSYLSVSPNLYGELLGSRDTVRQTINSAKLYSTNSFVTSYRIGRLVLGLSAMGNIDIESFASVLTADDSMRNDMPWRRFDLGLTSSLSYDIGRLSLDVSIPANYAMINGEGRPMFDPILSARYNLSQEFAVRTSASQTHSFSDLYDSYGGYVMNSYRSISSRGGKLNRTVRNYASVEAIYSDAIHALFVSARIAYSRNESDLTYGTLYNGDFSTIKQYDMRNESESTMMSFNASKRIQLLSATVKAGVDASESQYQYLRQDQLMPVTRRTLSANWGLDTRIGQHILLSYSGVCADSRSIFAKYAPAEIKTVNQRMTTSLLLGKRMAVRGSFQHYYNDMNEGEQRNLGFVDVGLSYTAGRMEYTINASNLLNTKTYSSTSFSTNTIYTTIYELRPVSVLLSVRFTLR